jgi:hypothetical protein
LTHRLRAVLRGSDEIDDAAVPDLRGDVLVGALVHADDVPDEVDLLRRRLAAERQRALVARDRMLCAPELLEADGLANPHAGVVRAARRVSTSRTGHEKE